MRLPTKAAILATFVATMLSACEKSTAKFRPGDKVRVKLTDTSGVIAARLSPFKDDLYFVKAPGQTKPKHWSYWNSEGPNWHIEGTYYDTELQAAQ